MKLSDKLALLAEGDADVWRVEKEPHDYNDGTAHFTNVVYTTHDAGGVTMDVRVMEYLTPATAELSGLLHNNVRQIIAALRAFGN